MTHACECMFVMVFFSVICINGRHVCIVGILDLNLLFQEVVSYNVYTF